MEENRESGKVEACIIENGMSEKRLEVQEEID
jgi:hypothetical protein